MNAENILDKITEGKVTMITGITSTKRTLVVKLMKGHLKRKGVKYLGTVSCGEDFGILSTLYQLQRILLNASETLQECFIVLEDYGKQSIAPLLLDLLEPKLIKELGLRVLLSTPTKEDFLICFDSESFDAFVSSETFAEHEVKELYEYAKETA